MEIDFPRLLLKIRFYLNAKKDAEVARVLGMSAGALSERRRRNSAPLEEIKIFCQEEGLDFDTFVSDCRPGATPFKQGNLKNVATVDKFLYCLTNGSDNEKYQLLGRIAELEQTIRIRKRSGEKK